MVREDVLRWILNQVRDPLVGLDVRGQIAALNSGRRRVLELIEQWGVDTVKARDERQSHRLTRARSCGSGCASCPTARWREVQYIDHDGHESEDLQDRLHADEARRTG